MKKYFSLFAFLLLFLLLPVTVSAIQWPAIGLTGGGNALDGIDTSVPGDGVADGDTALVYVDAGTSGWTLDYHWISADATAESVPTVINPDTGDGRWHLSKSSYKSITWVIENPTSSEDFGPKRLEHSGTIFKVVAVLKGSDTPSVTIQPKHGSSRGVGTPLFAAGQVVTSTTTGDVDVSGWNDNTFNADDWFFLTTTAQSGTVTELSVTAFFVYH